MVAAGFAPFDDGCWHFSLEKDPFAGQAFNFPVEGGILLVSKWDRR
jgi:hypothetical protein